MRKQLTAYVEKDSVKEDGTLAVCVATDSSVDRDGEIVDPAGLDFTNYLKNPVLLYAHDYRSDPIGKVLEIVRDGSRVLFKPQFAIDINPKAKMYHEMFKQGILNAFSIGFIAKEWNDRDNGNGQKTRVFVKSELLEISAVPVPANPQALVLAREYAAKAIGDDKEAAEQIVKEIELVEQEAQEKTVEQKLTEIADSVKAVGETAAEALRVAQEAKDAVATIAQDRVADNGESGGSKGATIQELTKAPEFRRAVLATVDKAMGVALRDNKRA